MEGDNLKERIQIMTKSFPIQSLALSVALVLSLMSGLALAEKNRWYVVKDKDGNCRLVEAESVLGPFKTRAEADKRMSKTCPKKGAQTSEGLRHRNEKQEVGEVEGRVHHRRDMDERRRSPEERVDATRTRHKQREDIQHDSMKKQQPSHVEGQMEKTKETVQGTMKDTKPMKDIKPMEEKIKDKKRDMPLPDDKR